MPFFPPSRPSIPGFFSIADQIAIINDLPPLEHFASSALNSRCIFTDVDFSLAPDKDFGSFLSRMVLGENLARHRNLQVRYLQTILPQYQWRFTSAPAFFHFASSVEGLCGIETLSKISSIVLELDFYDEPRWRTMLDVVEALGESTVHPSRPGKYLPGLRRLDLEFVSVPNGFAETAGQPLYADDSRHLWDWQALRNALANVRVAEANVYGLRDYAVESALVGDMTGATWRAWVREERARRMREAVGRRW